MPDGHHDPSNYRTRTVCVPELDDRVAALEVRVESLYAMLERRDRKIRALERKVK